MKRISVISLSVLFLFSLIVFYGCGQTHSGGGGGGGGSLEVTARIPALNATNISSSAAITLKFNNAINVSLFDPAKIITNLDMGGSSVTWEWSADHKTITMEGVSSYFAVTSTEAPVMVYLRDNGAFKDISGNQLTTGETLVKYSILTDLRRFMPYYVGQVINYIVNMDPSSGPITYETDTVMSGSVYGFVSAEVVYTSNEGEYIVTSKYFKVGTDEIRFHPGQMGPPSSASDGYAIIKAPVTPSQTWSDCIAGAVTFEVTTGNKEIISVPYGTYNAQKQVIDITANGSLVARQDIFLVYNLGLVKIDQYEPDLITKNMTSELISIY